jgi:hypothetical protein
MVSELPCMIAIPSESLETSVSREGHVGTGDDADIAWKDSKGGDDLVNRK